MDISINYLIKYQHAVATQNSAVICKPSCLLMCEKRKKNFVNFSLDILDFFLFNFKNKKYIYYILAALFIISTNDFHINLSFDLSPTFP